MIAWFSIFFHAKQESLLRNVNLIAVIAPGELANQTDKRLPRA